MDVDQAVAVEQSNFDGPDSKYVKLVSFDNREFVVTREHAMMSDTIATLLTGSEHFIEYKTNRVQFQTISGDILKMVCEYLKYKAYYKNHPVERIPKFKIKPKYALELLMAASFLNC